MRWGHGIVAMIIRKFGEQPSFNPLRRVAGEFYNVVRA
jgi:hypothetical protein